MVLNRLITLPSVNSSAMRAYMAAILEVTGMMSGEGFPMQKFLRHFSTHLAPKRGFPYPTLRRDSDGLVYVTDEGLRFFASRFTSSPAIRGQRTSRFEVIQMIRCMVATAAPAGWEAIEV